MSLWSGCNGSRTRGIVLEEVWSEGEYPSMRKHAEARRDYYASLIPGVEVWIHQHISCFSIRTHSRKLKRAAEQCVHTDPPSALVSAAGSENSAGG